VSEIRTSTCNRDCPDACGLVAEVVDGEIRSLRGDPSHPVTQGFVCLRTSRFPERLRAPDRLRSARIRRADGSFRDATLDEALDLVADRLAAIRAESGPAAILHYRSGGSLGLLKFVADGFFERFGPCSGTVGDICSGAGIAAQEADFGVSDSNDLFDLRNSRHVLLWGKNPTVSSVHVVPLLREIRARGATVTLIDPIATKARTYSDRYLQPRPGGDLALALGVARWLFQNDGIDPLAAHRCAGLDSLRELASRHPPDRWAELAGVPVDSIADLARDLADGPTAILVGWGMQRRRNGAAIVRALDALSAISGNLYVPGGGCSFYFRRRAAFAIDAISSGARARSLREPCLGDDILAAQDPPIRAVWVTAGNPVCMLPDSARVAAALGRTEFVVVADPFFTDTARLADVVLPVPTLLEDSDVLGAYGHHWLAESRPLVPPPDGVVHEVELFRRLAERLGVSGFDKSPDDYKRALLGRVAPQGADLDSLRRGAVRNPESRPVLFADGTVATPTGKVNLIGDVDELALTPAEDADHPLWLFSNSVAEAQSSQWSRALGDHLPVTIHPDSAPPKVGDGDVVRLVSEHAAILARVQFDASQRRDVALVPKGGHHSRGQSANSLMRAATTDLGLGAAYLDCRVRIEAT
jgi:anaerobic selenocysteine-containing dehydrogenase